MLGVLAVATSQVTLSDWDGEARTVQEGDDNLAPASLNLSRWRDEASSHKLGFAFAWLE